MKRLAFLLVPLALAGCASTANIALAPEPWRLDLIDNAPNDFEKGRQAILSMVGDYQVTFSFEETEALQAGYELRKGRDRDAYELVLLVADDDTTISLQHVLVHRGSGFVVKHWRQDWHYEATQRLEFTEDQTWRLRPIAADLTRGAWTQCVYEVGDAPRYCGTGKWNFDDADPVWTSDRGYRPLPRREYSQRSDYNVLEVVNAHIIRVDGWDHGQDNFKVVREGETETARIARERGYNTYRRITGYNFQPGYKYWDATEDYWQRIRTEWNQRMVTGDGIRLAYPVDGTKMIMDMYWQSERARRGKEVSDQEIHDLFEPWVKAPDSAS